MNGKVLGIIVAVAAVIALVTVLIVSSNGDDDKKEAPATSAPVSTPKAKVTASTTQSNQSTVTITASGFSPKTMTVKVGEAVTWKNESNNSVIVASDPHPTHTDLPGFESSALTSGGTYTFTFTKAGSFGYHNHNNPSTKGTVVAQ